MSIENFSQNLKNDKRDVGRIGYDGWNVQKLDKVSRSLHY